MTDARITAVCVVHTLLPEASNPDGYTSIDKRPVSGRVAVGPLGLAGDTQSNPKHHGGEEQAVYVYADEDAAWWADQLGREIAPGLFGENVRVSGVEVSGAEIGERWRLSAGDGAEMVLEVTSPRIPCAIFQKRMGERDWVKRFTERGAPGAYLKVIAGGTIAVGDRVEVIHRPGHGVTVADVLGRPDAEVLGRLLTAEAAGQCELGAKMREYAQRAVARG